MDVKTYLKYLEDIDLIESNFRKASLGISIREYRVLAMVEEQPLNLNNISRARSVTPQGIGRTCARLAKRGYLKIERDQRDKRAKRVTLTTEGIELADRCRAVLEKSIC